MRYLQFGVTMYDMAQGDTRLHRAGAEPGCTVRIADHEFDWQPSIGGEYAPTVRGRDERLEVPSTRATAAERLAARKARRRPRPDEPTE